MENKIKKNPKSFGDYAIPNRLQNQSKVIIYPREIWKECIFEVPEGSIKKRRYAVSNFGRFGSFYNSINEDLCLVKCGFTLGYYTIQFCYRKYNAETGKFHRGLYQMALHKALAELFIPNDDPDKIFIIHLDHNKANNELENLAWVSKEELGVHAAKNPKYIASGAIAKGRGKKLTVGKVKQIKKLCAEGKTRLRVIAVMFGVSATMVEDIKYGKKWKEVTI